jgi:anthranilate synthase component 1
MYHPSLKEFIKKAKEGHLIPVYREIPADLETPISIFSRLETGKYAFLLEGIEKGKEISRYCLLGSDPSLIFKTNGKRVEIIRGNRKENYETPNPLEALKKLVLSYKTVKDENLPGFVGGAVGYLGYDSACLLEELPNENPDDLNLPDALFFFAPTFLLFDHLKHSIKIVSCAQIREDPSKAYQEAIEKVATLIARLRKPTKLKSSISAKSVLDGADRQDQGSRIKIKSNLTKNEFKKMVEEIKRYIKAKEVRQVIISQRLETKINVPPFNIYRALRAINPSPYMFYLKYGNLRLIGASPENLVKLEGRRVITRPVASTRPRGKDAQQDLAMAQELFNSPKERSEHLMLAHLCKKELEEVCERGSIKMVKKMEIERYSHVMHLVSTISGRLKKDKEAFDLIYTCFPSATITGLPKKRAMKIIEKVESIKRGPYTGAIGTLSFSGDLDLGIVVRSIIIKGKRAYIPVGCGIVAASLPEKEYQETRYKAQAQIRAIETA